MAFMACAASRAEASMRRITVALVDQHTQADAHACDCASLRILTCMVANVCADATGLACVQVAVVGAIPLPHRLRRRPRQLPVGEVDQNGG
jgi:hypothetical protein